MAIGRLAILLARILDLLKRDWIVHVRHIFREANFVTDTLAMMGLGNHAALATWQSPPAKVALALFSDCSGTIHLR
ncbi:Reverse transcriptase-like [Sesbania bispinosa]|nr:Reverse transcriptase-like [Sesbania bispinosa]